MTNMAPPKPPDQPPAPITLLELLDCIERHVEIRTAVRDVAKREFGPDASRDREVRCLELIAGLVWTASCDKERFKEFSIDMQRKYGKWVKPSDREPVLEPVVEEATEE